MIRLCIRCARVLAELVAESLTAERQHLPQGDACAGYTVHASIADLVPYEPGDAQPARAGREP